MYDKFTINGNSETIEGPWTYESWIVVKQTVSPLIKRNSFGSEKKSKEKMLKNLKSGRDGLLSLIPPE